MKVINIDNPSKLQENVLKLKEMYIAHQLALDFDYVPNELEAEECINETSFQNVEELKSVAKKYEGHSCSDMESKIMALIYML